MSTISFENFIDETEQGVETLDETLTEAEEKLSAMAEEVAPVAFEAEQVEQEQEFCPVDLNPVQPDPLQPTKPEPVIDMENVPSLSGCAILGDINISVWSGKKLDREISDEVCDTKNAQSKKAAVVQKNLAADYKKLEDLQKFASGVRNYVYIVSQPWSDSGTRLFSSAKFLDVKEKLSEMETEFWNMVDGVVADYSNFVSAQAFTLGNMFKRDDYPDPSTIRSKFKFNTNFYPVPVAGDFRVDMQAEVVDYLKEQFERSYAERVNSAMQDAWDRTTKVINHISNKLAVKDEDKKTRLYASMFEEAEQLVDLLKGFNVANDPKLEQVRSELASVLDGLKPLGSWENAKDAVRKNPELRESVKAKVDAIRDNLQF